MSSGQRFAAPDNVAPVVNRSGQQRVQTSNAQRNHSSGAPCQDNTSRGSWVGQNLRQRGPMVQIGAEGLKRGERAPA